MPNARRDIWGNVFHLIYWYRIQHSFLNVIIEQINHALLWVQGNLGQIPTAKKLEERQGTSAPFWDTSV